MIPNNKLLHEFELTWSFYIVVDLHYLEQIGIYIALNLYL